MVNQLTQVAGFSGVGIKVVASQAHAEMLGDLASHNNYWSTLIVKQIQQLTAGHDRAHHDHGSRHHHDAPPRARLPLSLYELVAQGLARGFALDEALLQRPRVGGLRSGPPNGDGQGILKS